MGTACGLGGASILWGDEMVGQLDERGAWIRILPLDLGRGLFVLTLGSVAVVAALLGQEALATGCVGGIAGAAHTWTRSGE